MAMVSSGSSVGPPPQGYVGRLTGSGNAVRHHAKHLRLASTRHVHLRAPRSTKATHHTRSARSSHALLERGTIGAYDGGSNKASVELIGAASRFLGAIPVSLAVPTVGIVGKNCLVALLDALNPDDGVVVATW